MKTLISVLFVYILQIQYFNSIQANNILTCKPFFVLYFCVCFTIENACCQGYCASYTGRLSL